MKTLCKAILAVTLLMSWATTFANDHGPGPGHRGMPMVEQLVRALHRLDVSDEQQENIRAVLHDLKDEIRPILREMKTGHAQLKELIRAEEFDENAVAEVAAIEGELASQRTLITSKAFFVVLSYLTDEQRAELDEMAARHEDRRGEKHRRHN